MKIVSFRDRVERHVFASLGDHLDDGAALLVGAIKEKIRVQGPPRSEPYTPPHKDTTALYEGYSHETDREQLRSRIGSDRLYDLFLETGTDRMSPRPHVRSTLLERADDIAAEVCKPID